MFGIVMIQRIFILLFYSILCSVQLGFAASSGQKNFPKNLDELFAAAQNTPLTFVRCKGSNKQKPWLGCWKNGKVHSDALVDKDRSVTLYSDKMGIISSKRFGETAFTWKSARDLVQFSGSNFVVTYSLDQGIYLVSSSGKYLVLARPSAEEILDVHARTQIQENQPENKPQENKSQENKSTPPKQNGENTSSSKKSKEDKDLELKENLRILDEALR